jgi:repressor LexA
MKLANYLGCTVDDLLADEPPAREQANAIFLDQQNIHMIPLYESVSAGFGALAINDVIDYVPIYMTSPIEAAETLCIKVTGDSMYPKIEDGDIIQVHKQDSVDSGSIAVVLLDNEDGLVKKVLYGETWIELHSINPLYKTMRFNGSDVLRVRVLGKVNKIIKNV